MLSTISRIQSIIISVVFLATLLGNIFFFQQVFLGVILLAFYILFFGLHVGKGISPKETAGVQWWMGVWLLLSGIMITGSIIYYVAPFTGPVAYTIALLSIPIALWIGSKAKLGWFNKPHDLVQGKQHKIHWSVYFTGVVVIFGLYLVLSMFWDASTIEALRSPWEQVPEALFLIMSIIFLLLFVQLYRGRERWLSLVLLSAVLFTFLSAAVIIFPLGFGFDSFIHQATEQHIAEHGTITPKPFYYIGQYSLVLFTHHVFSLPIDLVDKLLVPLLAALLLPMAFYSAAAHLLQKKRIAAATLTGLFLLPLSSFIVTTPQGLANLWTLLAVLAAVPFMLRLERPRIYPLMFAAAATLAIHPIAGIPITLFIALLATDPSRQNERFKIPSRILYWIILISGSVLLPASFVINAALSGSKLGINLAALTPASIFSALHIDLFFENRFNPLLDFVYLYGFNTIAVIIITSIIGWWVYKKPLDGRLNAVWGIFFILIANFVILSTAVDFSFLIDYERLNYANRLVPLMTFFLVPFFILFLGAFFSRIRTSPIIIQVSSLVLISALASSAFYLTYPRDDAYEVSHGFNVSQSDINSVYAIDDQAGSESYAVLANQSVSAAAIRTLGFTRYYGDLFFYPVPTGGELYDLFLTMNIKPNRETAEAAIELLTDRCEDSACDLEPPKTLYYVVNDYWWQSERLVETAKGNADDWISIDDGATHIFRYNLE